MLNFKFPPLAQICGLAILCGVSVQSQKNNWLKYLTTAQIRYRSEPCRISALGGLGRDRKCARWFF